MKTILLIHGQWVGKWIWDGVIWEITQNEEKKYSGEIVVPCLPGHGLNSSYDRRRITTDHYVESSVTEVQVKQLVDVTVVVHSFAASYLSRIINQIKESVKRVVVIGGLIPCMGKSVFEFLPVRRRFGTRLFGPVEKGIVPPASLRHELIMHRKEESLVSEPYLPWVEPFNDSYYPDNIDFEYIVLGKDDIFDRRLQLKAASRLPNVVTSEIEANFLGPLTHSKEIGRIILGKGSDMVGRNGSKSN